MSDADLIGRVVTVTNPDLQSRWSGFAVAIAHHPSILIEDPESGRRYMFPLAWAELAT